MSDEQTLTSYVVPISILTAFIVNTKDPETLNSTIVSLLEKTANDEAVKTVFANASRDLTNIISKIDKTMSVVLVPNAFVPVKEQKESTIVVDFVEKFNAALQEHLDKNEQKSE